MTSGLIWGWLSPPTPSIPLGRKILSQSMVVCSGRRLVTRLRTRSPSTASSSFGLALEGQLEYQSLCSLLSIRLYSAMYRVAANSKLLSRHRGAVTLLYIQTHHLQPELIRIGPSSTMDFADAILGFRFLSIGLHSFLNSEKEETLMASDRHRHRMERDIHRIIL